MSNASAGTAADVTVRMGRDGVQVRTGRRTRVLLSDEPWGELHLYAPDVSELPDTFILHDEGAERPEEAFYWCEKTASAARKQAGGLWVLDFDAADNEGGRQPSGDLVDHQLTYTLVHRPAGEARGQRTVFDGRAQGRVFHNGGLLGGASSDDDFMWDFVALQCYLSDAVRMPENRVERAQVELRPPDVLKDAADALQAAPTTTAAWEPVADRERAWRAGTAPPEKATNDSSSTTGEDTQEDDEAADLARPLPDLETWISLIAMKEPSDVLSLDGVGPLPGAHAETGSPSPRRSGRGLHPQKACFAPSP